MKSTNSVRALIKASILSLGLCACASPMPGPPPPEAEEVSKELASVGSELFLNLIAEKSRLLDFEYRLNLARAESCKAVARPQFGILTGSADTLDKDWLKKVAAQNKIVAEKPTIIHVVVGSPFDRAGMQIGDELLEIGGQSVGSHSELIQLRMGIRETTPIQVRFVRSGEEMTIEIPVELGCPTLFELADNESLFPFSRLSVIFVPRGLMAYAKDDDVLAAALAHGMSHALFDQADQSALESERRADMMGILTAADAGFDVNKTIQYWEDMARAYPYAVLSDPREIAGRRGPGRNPLNELWGRNPHYYIAKRFRDIRNLVNQFRH